MARRLSCWLAAALITAGLGAPAGAQVADHLACFKVATATAKTAHTADVVPGDAAFPALSGCTVRVPAKLLCLDVRKENVVPAPPGAPDAGPARKYLCYKLRCPKAPATTTLTDQFGAHVIQLKRANLLCAPADLPTPTTSTTIGTSTSTTVPPPPCGDGGLDPGEACDDGNTLSGDGCSATCELEPPATAFRVTTLRLISPRVVADIPFGGCQDITDNAPTVFGGAVADSVNTTLQMSLDPTSAGGTYARHMVSLLRPLDPLSSAALLAMHLDAACQEAPTPDDCAPDAAPIVFVRDATNLGSGACFTPVPSDVNTRAGTPTAYIPTANTVSAPCFVSDEGELPLDLGAVVLPLRHARVTATYSGTPPDILVSGVMTGFLSDTAAADAIVPANVPVLGGDAFYSRLQAGNRSAQNSLGATVADGCNVGGGTNEDDGDTIGTERGFWIFLNFTAELVTWTGP